MIAGRLEIELLAGVARLQQDMRQVTATVGSAMADVQRYVADAKTALAGLGVTLGAGAFVGLIRGSIDAMDHLNDLSKSTSLAVETLAGLKIASKQSGGDLDSIAASINKLSVEMGKAPEKFKALGVSAKDPLEAFKQLSDIFVQLEDPQQRAAVAAAALGKSWAGAAPLLAEGGKKIGEMVEAGTKASGMTNEMARQADELNDKLVLLVGTGGALTKTVGPLLPLLNALADDLLKASQNSQSLGDSFSPLLEVMKVLVVVGSDVSFVFTTIGKDIARAIENVQLIAKGDFAGSRALGAAFKKDAEEARAALDKYQASIMAIGTSSKAIVAPVKEATAADKAAAKAAADKAAAFLAGTDATKKAADDMKRYLAALKVEEDQRREAAEAWAAYEKVRNDALLAAQKTIDQIEFETSTLRMSNEERQIAIALRALETSGITKQDVAYAALAEKTRAAIVEQQRVRTELATQQQALQDQAAVWNQLGDVVGNFFSDLVLHGKSAFDNLRKWVKQLLADMIALFAKRWILQLAAGSTTGAAGEALANQAAGTGSGTLAGSALNWAGGALASSGVGTAFMTGFTGGAAGLGGMELTGMAALGEYVGMAYGAIMDVLAMIPVWGWIAMAVVAVAAWLGGKGGGPKVGGSFFSGGSVPGTDNGRFYTPSQGDSAVRQIVETTLESYGTFARQLGGTPGSFNFGLGFDHDPQGDARSRVSSLLTDSNGRRLTGVTGLEMDDKEVPAALMLEAKRAFVAMLQNTDLHDALDALFDGIDVSKATAEELDAIIKRAIEMKGLIDSLAVVDIPGLTIESLQAMQFAGESLTDTMNSLMQGVSSYEQNFYTAEERQAVGMDRMRRQFEAMGLVMPTTREGFRALVESMLDGTESGARLYRWLISINSAFADLVPALEDVNDTITDVADTATAAVQMIDASLNQNHRNFDDLLTQYSQSKPDRDALGKYLNGLVTGDSSVLDGPGRLAEARRQYDTLLAAYNGGDMSVIGQLQGAHQTALGLYGNVYGTAGSEYNDFFRSSFTDLSTIAGVKDLNQRTAEAAEATQALMQRVAASVEAQEGRIISLQQSVDRGNGMVERAVRDSGDRVARAVEANSLGGR